MGDLMIQFMMVIFLLLLFMSILYKSISAIQRLGGFGGYTKWVIAGILTIIFIYNNPPHWADSIHLDDLQVATGVLDYRKVSINSRAFFLIGSGDDEQYWDFRACGDGSAVSVRCKGKEITVWHKDYVVYQVERDGKIIYSIENSNRRILLGNFSNLIWYGLQFCLLPIFYIIIVPRVSNLKEEEKWKKFEDRLTTEEESKPTEEVQTPITSQSEIKNVPRMKSLTIQTTPRQSPNIRPTIVANPLPIINNNEGKIVQRFCRHCGTELGKTVEVEQYGRRIGWDYEQYKFCPNCGLDSDPNMPVKAKPKDEETVKLLIGLFLFMSGLIAPVLVIMIASGGMDILLECLGIMVAISFIVWLFSEKIHDCPSCGRLYTKEHFCPNCGHDLR